LPCSAKGTMSEKISSDRLKGHTAGPSGTKTRGGGEVEKGKRPEKSKR